VRGSRESEVRKRMRGNKTEINIGSYCGASKALAPLGNTEKIRR